MTLTTMTSHFPEGWSEARVRRVLAHYEGQTDEEAVAEDEAPFGNEGETMVAVPRELVPAVRELIGQHQAQAKNGDTEG